MITQRSTKAKTVIQVRSGALVLFSVTLNCRLLQQNSELKQPLLICNQMSYYDLKIDL